MLFNSLLDRQTCPVHDDVAHPRAIHNGVASAPPLPLHLLNYARHVLEQLPQHLLRYLARAAVNEAKRHVWSLAICQLAIVSLLTSFNPLISSSISRRRSASNAS